ncbi:complex I NDUFA9 subunit family protein [Bordetella genomosp. 11]|uniref:NAD-dependent dehydratase n=1 Tax=Bordetella genomosp. 11 TaxID=1416808 RepID=A0A261V0Z3_9BORD|nr:complex I NDUFA9 subunit family protein [Bordetella genomosp. 11]OZI67190.1 NAD-dependent dehydratase [Bordetella genomosp. 11]
MRILIIGGTGFIGRHLVARLGVAQHQVHVPTRLYARGRDLQVVPTVTLSQTDVYDDAALDAVLADCDVAINLVGILHDGRGRPYGQGYARAHVELPRRIAQGCVRHGVRRLIHVSALGADSNGPSMYLRSKGDGEAALRDAYAAARDGAWTIVRPSVVFGHDDRFTNLFAGLARWLPVLPLAGARARMQPVYVEDVAAAIDAMLSNPHTYGKVYELAGPQVHTLGEIAGMCAKWSGHPRSVINIPMGLGRLQAGVLACLPGTPLMTPDNLDSLTVDNVAREPMAPELGVVPTAMEAVVPGYLASPRARGI